MGCRSHELIVHLSQAQACYAVASRHPSSSVLLLVLHVLGKGDLGHAAGALLRA